ncbi:hypothetical protein Dsin_005861 [Dipteronia sinensis]|uniref:RNase H type-1 domain-containing protein n=1 Tax=Dipteronia sinensis TaxID=43782 RepID=A0AAE0EFB0_9ROSI|nr:hypothetical protein Dsin_005861 [Dipteronia sinensis]
MTAGVYRVQSRNSSQIAEALAILCGIEFAIDIGQVPIEIQSDAFGVVKFVNEKVTPLADTRIILSDIQELLCIVPIVSVSYVSRKADMVAHCLVKIALTISENHFWLEAYPPIVEKWILGDVPG